MQESAQLDSDKAARTVAKKEQFGRGGFELNRQQVDDALRALAILQPFAISLTKAAEYVARHEKPERGDITLSALVDLFVE